MLKKISVREWVGLGLIIILTGLVSQLIIDRRGYSEISTKIRDCIEIGVLFGSFSIGFWGLQIKKRFTENDIYQKIWIIFCFLSLMFTVFFALVDWFIYNYSTMQQYRFLALKEKLWSPLPFLTVILLKKINGHSFF